MFVLIVMAMGLLVSCTFPIDGTASEASTASNSTTPTAVEESPVETTDTSADTSTNANDATSEEDTTASATAEESATSEVNPPEGEYKGIPVGFTVEGFPYRGSPDAPIVMYEYSDFQCPFCSRYFVQTEPALDESYVRSGQVRVVFRDFPLADLHPNAPAAHVAALCAAEQGAESYWQMHARLFQTQNEWNQSADAPAYFTGLAGDIGLDLAAYQSCVDTGQKETLIAQGVTEARALGFGGTEFSFCTRSNK
ncbi:MAG: thioredoxin domain-containing protein [Caldilineaceae bacterium]